MDPTIDAGLLWIAEAALCAPLPKGWSEYTDANGNVYFHKAAEGASTWEHPLDEHFRKMYKEEKANPSGRDGMPPPSGGRDELKYLDGIRCAEARAWWRTMIGSKETKVGGLSDALSGWLEDKGQSCAESQRLTNVAIAKMGRTAEGKVSFEEFNAFVERHMSSAFTADQVQSTVARIEITLEADEQQDRPQQAPAGLDMGEMPQFHLTSDRSSHSEERTMDDGADDGLDNFAGHDLATEAELRRKEKEARKRKKKKEKKRREREKARQESERAGAGGGAGSLQAQALDMLGAGDVGSGGDDDDFSSPLNSGRGPSDGGLDGLYDEVFSGTTDTGHTGGGRINDGLDGFRPLSKKLPPARLPTLSGGGGLPGLREPGALPSLPGDGGTGKPDFAAFVDLPPKPALGSLGGLKPLGGLAPLKPLGGLAALPLPGRGGGPELDAFGAPKLPP